MSSLTLDEGLFEVTDPRRGPTAAVVAIWVAWMVLAGFMMLNHEPWRDELQAWALARSVGNPFELIQYTRGEGHPPGWYLVLWPLARVAPGVMTLQVASLAMAGGAAWLIVRHLPVSLGVRALVIFSYFPLFELAIVARNYVLAYLLVVIALWLAHRPGTHPAFIAVTLLAAVGASITVAPLVVAMALALWGGKWFASPRRHPAQWRWVAAVPGVLLAAAIVVQPSRGNNPAVRLDDVAPVSLWTNMAAPVRALAPFSPLRVSFWGNPTVAGWGEWTPWLGLFVVVCVALAVRHSLSALTIWLVSSVGLVMLVTFADQGLPPRNVSAVWLGALAAVWVAAADRLAMPAAQRRPLPVPLMAGASLLLAAGLWAGIWAAWSDATTPFSAGDGAAQWVRQQTSDDIVILCAVSRPTCSSVAIRLNTPAYVSAALNSFTFVDWAPGWRQVLRPSDIAPNAQILAETTGREVFVVAPEFGYPVGCAAGWSPPRTITSERMRVCRGDQLVDMRP
jgi:hypothetical protein